jgi:hypothetical protein
MPARSRPKDGVASLAFPGIQEINTKNQTNKTVPRTSAQRAR